MNNVLTVHATDAKSHARVMMMQNEGARMLSRGYYGRFCGLGVKYLLWYIKPIRVVPVYFLICHTSQTPLT